MTDMPTRSSVRRLLMLALALLAVAGLWLAPPALARIVINTIDTTAFLSEQGRHITLTGPLSCDQVQFVDLRVTVTQRETGAVAEGRLRFVGTPEQQTWTLEAKTQGKNGFAPGAGRAVALATTTSKGKADDAHQWLVDVVLEEN